MQKTYSGIFDYLGYHRAPSRCQIDIWSGDKQVIVMMTEIAENTGTSVTNRSEAIASAVRFQHNLSGYNVTWIEHYGAVSYHGGRASETYTQVTYGWHGGTARHPEWKALTQEQVEALLAQV